MWIFSRCVFYHKATAEINGARSVKTASAVLTEYAKKIANPSVCVSTMPELYREASTSVTAGGGSRIRTGDMLLAKQPLPSLPLHFSRNWVAD